MKSVTTHTSFGLVTPRRSLLALFCQLRQLLLPSFLAPRSSAACLPSLAPPCCIASAWPALASFPHNLSLFFFQYLHFSSPLLPPPPPLPHPHLHPFLLSPSPPTHLRTQQSFAVLIAPNKGCSLTQLKALVFGCSTFSSIERGQISSLPLAIFIHEIILCLAQSAASAVLFFARLSFAAAVVVAIFLVFSQTQRNISINGAMLESSSSFSSQVFHIIIISAVSHIVVNFHEIIPAFFLVSL